MIKKIIFIIIFAFCVLNTRESARADEILSIEDFDLSAGNKILDDSGYDDIDFNHMLDKIMRGELADVAECVISEVCSATVGNFKTVKSTLINIVSVIIISAFFTNFTNVFSKEDIAETGFYICYLLLISAIITLFDSFCVIASDFLKLIFAFMTGVVPAYFVSIAIIGQVSAAGFYQLTLAIIATSEFIFLNVVIPMIKVYVAISLVNNVSREDFLSKTTELIGNFIRFVNTLMITIVTGLNIIQGMILPAADNAKNMAIRKFVGSMPVFGDGAEAVSGIAFGAVNLIKNTIGTFMIIIIVMICLVPYIKIQLYSAAVQLVTALTQPVADKRIVDSLGCMAKGAKLLAHVMVSASLLFIISIAIICMTTGGQ